MERKIVQRIREILTEEKELLLSLKNQNWKNIKLEREKVNKI